MNICILGASGYLGSVLYQVFAADHRVSGTCCHCPLPGLVRYDLLEDDPANLPIDWSRIESVVLATGITRIEECAKDPQRTEQLNVTAVRRFCEFAARQNLHVTFISTDHVYDGTPSAGGNLRMHREDEPLQPSTTYGRQKLSAERGIQEIVKEHLIVRLSMNVTLARRVAFPFSSWADALYRGEPLRLAQDLKHCITWVFDTARALEVALRRRAIGVYNLSETTCLSRLEWGKEVCAAIEADPKLVTACHVDDLNFREPRPQDVSLDTSKFCDEIGFEFTPPDEILRILGEMYQVKS